MKKSYFGEMTYGIDDVAHIWLDYGGYEPPDRDSRLLSAERRY
jgi:hypothetical protein